MTEFRSGPVAGTARIAGVTFASKALQFAEVEGLAIFEGDIVLGPVDVFRAAQSTGELTQKSIGISGQQFRWPNATIPYDFDPSMPNQQRVTDAIAHWEASTPIRFVLRTTANQAQFGDFIRFQNGGGCSSQVGRRGGMQIITLGNGCNTGNAIHEIGHSVGLWHEQSREDRDAFIDIAWANIDPAMQHNFDQHIADGDDLGAYDFGSIMHYPATAFSINGQATIVPRQPLPPGVVMGQRNGLSPGDIAGVRTMYPTQITIKEVSKDPISDPTGTIKELIKDPIRDPTIKELAKDPIHDPTIKELAKDPIHDPIHDPTIKELVKDPIRDPLPTIREVTGFPGPLGPLGQSPGTGMGSQTASPFVLGAPSRAARPQNSEVLAAEIQAQVVELAHLLIALEQQYADTAAAYDAAVTRFNDFSQGRGT